MSVAKALIGQGHLDILTLCTGIGEGNPDFPSWVPDLSKPRIRAYFQQRALQRKEVPPKSILQPQFSASGTEKVNLTFSDSATTPLDSVQLLIDAVYVGEVSCVGTIWGSNENSSGIWLSELEAMSQETYGNDRSAQLEAVFRTAVADQDRRDAEKKPRLSKNSIDKILLKLGGMKLQDATKESLEKLELVEYHGEMKLLGSGRRPFSIRDGKQIGLAPRQTQPGDVVYIIAGAVVPFIFRRGGDEQLRMIGEAYVHSIMDGEVMKENPSRTRITIA
ncbi:hypothetical protein F4780DRAFT_81371 [Xylariomycetidae sp. FL0641]|nr:hypothetical protein F4780DRAFT_81371 [Xylariomycetidae sp. FL0641]